MAWLSWLFKPAPEWTPEDPLDELRFLKKRRQALLESLASLRAFGFDSIAEDDEQALKAVDRRILVLQL
ncbi:MAG TPA: hypothetical protein VG457_00635, partial [Planctomycetota bacterium]|nr:hypothetical protein [Planctomycetota bacterium]